MAAEAEMQPNVPKFFLPFSTKFKYVVKSDVVAFYRHVDHELLRDQLTLIGGDYEAITYLMQFLGELQGRSTGLPQASTPSDILAEVYISAVERSMIRRGHHVWRFSDDFRIACTSYTHTMDAIDDLDQALRSMGLTLNEFKTTTPSYANYYLDSMDLEESPGGPIQKEDAEDIVGDYTDDFDQDPDSAAEYLERFSPTPDGDAQLSLRDAGAAEVRMARRALSSLAKSKDLRALDSVAEIVRFMAPVTPSAMRYLIQLGQAKRSRTRIAAVLDELAHKAALNDWQKTWIIHAYDATGCLTLKRNRTSRIEWIRHETESRSNAILSAHGVWVLARHHEVDAPQIMNFNNSAPTALSIFYAAAMSHVDDPTKGAKAFDEPLLRRIVTNS
ncbi:RNA-directed DNA polymerase [Janibacter sp. CX7]|uniref:RNA-directed DNA polymerase n=1 Tax=Janibacter sp. CX7 TaxID=2963431 RepID=UPI0020CD473E|nr:RNA-directed DNA polymerase [Janibacter sp. CX7]UTT67297.1 RNA-directed DNA polymerase [Janibacter sp. CX7]